MNKKVLLVDDEPDLNLTLKLNLEENGFKVDSFTDPLVALENFRGEAGQYDMIILDIKMPNMNGYELYRQIKKIDDKAKVCFLTAGEMYYGVYTDIFNRLDGIYFIQKPIENKELIARLNKLVMLDSQANKTT
jgi:two-component system catabolic regulation response regulator CreB/two-component system response regulator ChvI